MGSQWLYEVMGDEVGPISSVELRNLAQRGTVTRDTPVRQAPDGDWILAERVQGLFPESNEPPRPMQVAVATPVESQPTDSSHAPCRARPVTTRLSPRVGAIILAGSLALVVLIGAIIIGTRKSAEDEYQKALILYNQESEALENLCKQLQAVQLAFDQRMRGFDAEMEKMESLNAQMQEMGIAVDQKTLADLLKMIAQVNAIKLEFHQKTILPLQREIKEQQKRVVLAKEKKEKTESNLRQ
jgi:hypothetical protein